MGGRQLVWAEVVALGQNVRTAEVGDRVLFSRTTAMRLKLESGLHHVARA